MDASQNHAVIQRTLAAAHALTEASEAHGALAGALCALVPYGVRDWLVEILPDEGEPVAVDPVLEQLYYTTVASLASPDMTFDVLLPDDSEPLGARARALSEWCHGFLYGLGSSGAGDPRRLPGDAGEIARDLSEITRAEVDLGEGSEDNEAAFAELVEFVRVGVQIIFEELQPARERFHVDVPQRLH